MTPTGNKFAFATSARLSSFDNAGKTEVYVFDASSAQLTCVSCDPAGQRPGGSTALSNASLGGREDLDPTISADGRILAFETGDRLVAEDTNARRDVYLYVDGRLELVSPGNTINDALLIGMSETGRDVFFATADSLVRADQDGGSLDVYDARVGGGFPEPEEQPTTSCQGDACQGLPGSPAPTAPPGSELFSLDEQARDAPERASSSLVLERISRRDTQRFAAGGTLRLRISASGGRVVIARVTARIRGGVRTLASARVLSNRDGVATRTLSLKLNRAGRAAVAQRRRLPVRVTVMFADARMKRTVSLTLVRTTR